VRAALAAASGEFSAILDGLLHGRRIVVNRHQDAQRRHRHRVSCGTGHRPTGTGHGLTLIQATAEGPHGLPSPLEQQQPAEDEYHEEWPYAQALEATPLEHVKRLGAATGGEGNELASAAAEPDLANALGHTARRSARGRR
jgi:hypothetical protein